MPCGWKRRRIFVWFQKDEDDWFVLHLTLHDVALVSISVGQKNLYSMLDAQTGRFQLNQPSQKKKSERQALNPISS